jgi:sortase A
VVEGEDSWTLQVAVGHLADTPPPWQHGNTALAAHRDTFFRGLQNLREGDAIDIATRYGTFRYRVRTTLVVEPGAAWVLQPLGTDSVTLITCFPFTYVGSAPRRFVVQGERVTQASDHM